MRHLVRQLRPALRSLSLAALCAAALATPARAQRPALSWGPMVLTTASGERVEVDTATLTVPRNRRRPGSGTLTLPLVRFRGTGAAPGAPMVYLSGGTGSGIAAALGPRFALFQALRELGDVVTLDLRGAAGSRPRVECPAAEPLPVAAPLTYDTVAAVLTRNARACAAALRAAGVELEGHNVRETVEDVEALRLALGAPKVRVWGISTGSQLGLEYLRRHGGRVERAVLAGIQGPDQALHSPAGEDAVIHALSARLRARGDTTPELAGLLRAVFDSLERRPRTVAVRDRRSGDTVRVGLGRFDAQLLVAGTLGDRRQMNLLPAVFGAAARGNYAPLAALKLEGVRSGITSPFEWLSDCQSGAPEARQRRVAAEAGTALLGRATLDFPESCAGWGVPELDLSYRAPVRSPVPVLLISGTLDGRTPVRNAEEVLRGLPHGVHLVIDGASHGDDLFLSSPEIAATMLDFFRGRPVRSRTLALPVR